MTKRKTPGFTLIGDWTDSEGTLFVSSGAVFGFFGPESPFAQVVPLLSWKASDLDQQMSWIRLNQIPVLNFWRLVTLAWSWHLEFQWHYIEDITVTDVKFSADDFLGKHSSWIVSNLLYLVMFVSKYTFCPDFVNHFAVNRWKQEGNENQFRIPKAHEHKAVIKK